MGFWSTLNYGTSLLPSSSIPPLIFINGSLSLRYLFYQISLRNFFVGSITFEPWKRLWKSWAPNKCKTFVWLAIRNRCWTADRLQKRGLPHLERCPLCDQDLREYSTHSNILCIRTGILVCCPTATEFSPPGTQQQHCLLC